MTQIVVTHNVADVKTWLSYSAERAEAVAGLGVSNVVDHVAADGSNVIAITGDADDVDGLLAALAAPPDELGEAMQRHGVQPPLTVFVRG